MDILINLFEGFVIRFLWVLHATRLRPTPGLCPPACSEGHTYKWPCRARIQRSLYNTSIKYAHYDSPTPSGGVALAKLEREISKKLTLDPEPQPSDGPDYHADHADWKQRNG